MTWNNLRTNRANSPPSNSGFSARRLSASLLLSFAISLPLGCDPQSNLENGSYGKYLASPKLISSDKPAKVDRRQKIANNTVLEHNAEHRGRIRILFAGRGFEPQSFDPVADGQTLIAPGIYHKAKAQGS
ncbi:MAG TPA: hypothetical protein VE170_18620, partial [Candidatus Limnocylindria bacterium]|nr:hypothetical protein [Candidatus Limnocylindria bacterium]